jgi:hypothetical protein
MVAAAKRLIICADDFGLDTAVNEAVEQASRDGILTCTSLMVGAPAAEDAIQRAKSLPNLKVGLHITLTAGTAVLNPSYIPDIVDSAGNFENSMVTAGFRYGLMPKVQRQVEAEIHAQFEAFKATGLKLDHVNAHRHFHIHPVLAAMIVRIGREYGLKAMRVPLEPIKTLRHAAALEGKKVSYPLYLPWVWLLKKYLSHQGLKTNDHILGLAWSGGMIENRVSRLLEALPDGITEIYFHPATHRTPSLVKAMPTYQHIEEYQALMSAGLHQIIDTKGIKLISYSDLVSAA